MDANERKLVAISSPSSMVLDPVALQSFRPLLFLPSMALDSGTPCRNDETGTEWLRCAYLRLFAFIASITLVREAHIVETMDFKSLHFQSIVVDRG